MTKILYANDEPTYVITPTSKLVRLSNGLYDLVNVEPTKLKKHPLISIEHYHRSDADIWVRFVRMLPTGSWTSQHYYITDKQAVRLSRVVGRAGGQVSPRYNGWNWKPTASAMLKGGGGNE